jgi:hypothetical protein
VLAKQVFTAGHPVPLQEINGGILSSETLLRPSLGYLDAFRQPPYLLLITVSQETGSYHRWSGKVRGHWYLTSMQLFTCSESHLCHLDRLAPMHKPLFCCLLLASAIRDQDKKKLA